MPTRILFVDDEPDLELLIRQKFRKQIRRKEVVLAFAGNGSEALAVLDQSEEEFDLIITDINMPVMTGLELLGALSERELSCPVVVLSAYGDMANIRTAMNRGAFDFLTKPIDFSDLTITRDKALAHVESVRERGRLQREKEQLEKRASFVRETFGRYLSDSVVQTLLDEPKGLSLGGEKRQISILMSDLRGFTSLCERLAPETVVSMLNSYFSVMIDIVLAHGGTIDELLGDAVLVLFGAPLQQDDHADQAVRCAVAMQRAMEAVNRENVARDLPRLEMGIAVNTGEAVVGNIGSRRRTKYGVVGSHVNLTARIEALTVGHQVLISDATLGACALPLDTTNELTFVAKGFEDPVKVHELRGVVGDASLTVPRVEPQLHALSETVPVRFSATTTTVSRPASAHKGHIVRASPHHCEVVSDDAHAIDPLSALGLRMADEDEPTTVHGKVVGKPSRDTLLVRFTYLPPAAATRLEGLTVEQVDPEEAAMLSARRTLILDAPPVATPPSPVPCPPKTPDEAPSPERPDPHATHNHLATLGLMMAGVAHDIRNPLSFIVGFSDMSTELCEEISTELEGRAAPDLFGDVGETLAAIRDNLSKIKAHGGRANELIQTMMDTIRGTRLPPEAIDLNRELGGHLDLFEVSMRGAGATPGPTLVRDFEEGLGEVHIAAQDVSRIVLNLVQNACDAAMAKDPDKRKDAPRVRVQTRSREAMVEIRVHDNGVGISDEVKQAIFEPLFTTKGARDGLGLGLALVREIIETAGGSIDFETEPGEYTEFIVTLPRPA